MQNDPNQPQRPPYEQPLAGPLPPYGPPPAEQVPPYGPPYGPPPYGLPPQRGSLKWLWITLIVVGTIVILSCGACVALAFSGSGAISTFTRVIRQGADAGLTVSQYYESVRARDYAQAYSYLDPNATVEGQQVTQTTFIHKAQQVDRDKGLIRNVTSKSLQFSDNAQQATIQMNVTRGQQTYVVTLQLKSEGKTWKIMSADGI